MESIYYDYHLWPSNKKIQNMYPKHLTWWRTCWRLSPPGQSILWETWPQHEPCRYRPSSVELDQSLPPSPDDRDPLGSSWQQDPCKTHWKYVWLFVWGFLSHSRIFHFYGDVIIALWRDANFDLCSALMAIEQWGFFSVPHLLWHRALVYNGHLWGPVTLTPIAEHLALELSPPFFTNLGLSWLGFKLSACEANALTDCATAAVWKYVQLYSYIDWLYWLIKAYQM